MKKTLTTILLLLLTTAVSAPADDFWAIYAENFAYRHAINGNYIPAIPSPERVSPDTTRNLALKSFGVAFGVRFSQIASARKKELVQNCLFSAEPYRCAFEGVMRDTVDETGFMPQIRFSNRFIKKAWKFYDRTLRDNESIDDRMRRAKRVPPWKKFNPKVNFQLDHPELTVALPFYTYSSIYIEPRWGTRNGPHLIVVKNNFSVDFGEEGAALQFRLLKNPVGRGYYTIHVHSDRSVTLDTFMLIY